MWNVAQLQVRGCVRTIRAYTWKQMHLKYFEITYSESLLFPCAPFYTKDSQNFLPTWAGEQWWRSKPWNHDNSSYKTMRSPTPVELLEAGAQRLFTKSSLQEPYGAILYLEILRADMSRLLKRLHLISRDRSLITEIRSFCGLKLLW